MKELTIIQMENFVKYLPPLDFVHYKGQSGRIGVIGGCFEYTGAPFFAAKTVLLLGGDLSHIFCHKKAGVPIKSYAPEVIVHPCLLTIDKKDATDEARVAFSVKQIMNWIPALNGCVIGPGLGRDPLMLEIASEFIQQYQKTGKPLVLDGDALFLVSQKPDLVRGVKQFILTPNGGEFIRLIQALDLPKEASCKDVAHALGGVTVFAKGFHDIVSDGENECVFEFEGSPRRVGGQGDLTAGAMALFATYAPNDYFAAAGACSEVVRRAAVAAFKRKGRSMIVGDMMDEIHNVLPESWNAVVPRK